MATVKGGKKRDFKTTRIFRDYCRTKIKEGFINTGNGNWRRRDNSSADKMVAAGYGVIS